MRVLVCGDRNWTNKLPIIRELGFLSKKIECVIEGEALGADSIARDIAEYVGIPVIKFPANWRKFGKAAGPIRNLQMIQEGKPDLVLAFHPDINTSKGTKNMVHLAKMHNIPVKVFSE
jgi:hypothetical protein